MKYFFSGVAAIVSLYIASLYFVNDELICLREVSDACCKELWGNKQSLRDMEFCSLHNKIYNCIKNGLVECNNQLAGDADQVLTAIGDMCTDRTRLNDEMKKYMPCITRVKTNPSPAVYACMNDTIEAFKDLTDKTEENLEKFHGATCKQLDSSMNCLLKLTGETCGKDAEAFLKETSKPIIDFHKKVCNATNNKESLYLVHFGVPI